MSRTWSHRLSPTDDGVPAPGPRPTPAPWSLAGRAGAGSRLDLASRISLAADLQGSAGNAAAGRLLGLVRTDRRKEPPDGAREIMETGSGGTRGLTRTSYVANPPIFRTARVEQTGGTWSTRPNEIRLPSLDHEVFYPAPGRHRLRDYGAGGHFLQVTEAWSGKLLQGEEEHVDDTDRAWEMTWGRIAGVINEMAAGTAFTGATADEARAAAWRAFVGRLPEALRPAGDTATTEAQEAKWGAEDTTTIFRRMMRETQRARDASGWHTPDQNLMAMEGDSRVDELAVGHSRIGEVPSQRLMSEAWDRITRG